MEADWPRHGALLPHFMTGNSARSPLRSGPRLLILHHHIVRMGGTDDEVIAGVRAGGFKGRVVGGEGFGEVL